MVVTCNKDDMTAGMSGTVSAPAVGFVVVLNSAIRIAVRGRRVERASLVLVVIPSSLFRRSPFCGEATVDCVKYKRASLTDWVRPVDCVEDKRASLADLAHPAGPWPR